MIAHLRVNTVGNVNWAWALGKLKYITIAPKNVITYIQSGNVVFQSEIIDQSELSKKLEQEISNTFGFAASVIIRKSEDFQKLIKYNPFKNHDPSKLHVTFFSRKPYSPPDEEINKVKNAAEDFLVSNKEIYLFCPNGYGKTKLTNSFLEKKQELLLPHGTGKQ